MTPSLSASSAERLFASVTANSAHSALRPRICAKDRMYAVESLITFFSMVEGGASACLGCEPPPRATGLAAPTCVPGAMAAIWLAYMIKVPALVARAPLGATYVTTGVIEVTMA